MSAPAKILTASEPWAEYQLEDGTLLRFRFTACNFRRTGKQTAEDDPEYSFSQQVQVETHAPKQRPIGPGQPVNIRPRLKAGVPLAEGWKYVGPSEPIGDNGMPSDSPYCAPAEDCG